MYRKEYTTKEYYVRITKTVGAIVKVVSDASEFDEDDACLAAEIEMENDSIDTEPLSCESETIEDYSYGRIVPLKEINPNLKYQTIEY